MNGGSKFFTLHSSLFIFMIIFAAETSKRYGMKTKRYQTLYIRSMAAGLLAVSLTVLVPCQAQEKKMAANIGAGVGRHAADGSLSSYVNIGLFANVDTLRGVQLSAFTGVARREMRGVNAALLSAVSHGDASGVQAAGAVNASSGAMRGVQLAGIANVAREFSGIQLAGLTNACTAPMRGIQLSAVTNISMGVRRGMQISGAANICSSYMRGIQAAIYNYADTLNGSQIGLFNVCVSHPRGVQVGIINYSRDTLARKIGLVNINPSTRLDFMVYGGSSTKTNFAVRFRNRSTYNIIGIGTHYMGFDEDFSGALFYRIGQYFMLTPRLSLSGDLGFYHVETFAKNSSGSPERLYSLQARVNLDWQLGRTLGAFVSAGYGDTRYYCHSRRYRDRAIIEAGLSLKYNRK